MGAPGVRAGGNRTRLGLLVLLGLLLLAALGPAGTAAAGARSARPLPALAVPAEAWTTYHGTENRSGYSTLGGPSLATLEWTRCVSSYHLRSSPVVDATRLYAADDFGTVYALNLSDNGSVVWNRSLSVEPVALDVAAGELLTAADGGTLTALDAGTGAPLWQLSLGAPIVQGIAVSGGAIVVGTAAGLVEAFNLTTGSALWRATLDGPAGGAPSADGGLLFVVSANGTLEALTPGGAVAWRTSVGADVATAPAAGGGRVVVGDLAGRVSAFDEATGALEWVRAGALGGHTDSIHATPVLAPGSVFAQLDSGSILAVDASNGSVEWQTGGQYSPFDNLAAPVGTPDALYAVLNGLFEIARIDPVTGQLLAAASIGTYTFASPALAAGTLYVASDGGCVTAFGRPGGALRYPVLGTVSTAAGSPVAGATVTAGGTAATTGANGSFALELPNGSYALAVTANGFIPASVPLTVDGPAPPLAIVLARLFLYPVSGTVASGGSGAAIPGVTVTLAGPYGFLASAVTGANGTFRLSAPNGTALLRTGATPEFLAATATLSVDGRAVTGVLLRPSPAPPAPGATDSGGLAAVLPMLAIAAAVGGIGVWEAGRRRVAQGLSPAILSPFARYVVMRAILIPVQTVLLLAVLYFFGTVVPAVGLRRPVAALAPGHVSPGCTWADPACSTSAFFWGFGTLVERLFTGDWGYAVYKDLREPVTQFLAWWLPNSVELGAVALALSVAIAYPLALRAGWNPEGRLDPAARTAAAIGMLLPSFLVGLLLVLGFAPGFRSVFGDSPFGELPSTTWFQAHGGYPAWVGVGSNTSPTGLPLVDGLLHGDLAFEGVVLAKTLLQATAIALVYVAVFLRHARHLAADAAREPHVAAARARGVSESRLLWTHTGRRVLPVYLLLVGLTLPVFIGTQAVIETVFSDPGVGTLFILQITHLQQVPLGFTGPLSGNFYQVGIFLLILLVLGATLLADLVARSLDPRERRRA